MGVIGGDMPMAMEISTVTQPQTINDLILDAADEGIFWP